MITDKLKSYGSARKNMCLGIKHRGMALFPYSRYAATIAVSPELNHVALLNLAHFLRFPS
jgi:hypothetical protein